MVRPLPNSNFDSANFDCSLCFPFLLDLHPHPYPVLTQASGVSTHPERVADENSATAEETVAGAAESKEKVDNTRKPLSIIEETPQENKPSIDGETTPQTDADVEMSQNDEKEADQTSSEQTADQKQSDEVDAEVITSTVADVASNEPIGNQTSEVGDNIEDKKIYSSSDKQCDKKDDDPPRFPWLEKVTTASNPFLCTCTLPLPRSVPPPYPYLALYLHPTLTSLCTSTLPLPCQLHSQLLLQVLVSLSSRVFSSCRLTLT